MKLVTPVALHDWLAEFDAPQRAGVVDIIVREANALVEEADNRLGVPGATKSLRLARERVARSVLNPSRGVLSVELHGPQVKFGDISLVGVTELRAQLDASAMRVLRGTMTRSKDLAEGNHNDDEAARAS